MSDINLSLPSKVSRLNWQNRVIVKKGLLLKHDWGKKMLWVINAYLIIGLIFAVYFTLAGCSRIDPRVASASMLVRLIWLPAALLLWPLLLKKALQASRRESNGEVVK